MDNLLRNCVITGLILLAPFWVTYHYLANPEVNESLVKIEITEPEPQVSPPIVFAEPDLPTGNSIIQPLVIYPETFYTAARITEMTDSGVRAIPKGVMVIVLDREGDNVSIRFGNITLKTSARNITSDIKEIEKLTSK